MVDTMFSVDVCDHYGYTGALWLPETWARGNRLFSSHRITLWSQSACLQAHVTDRNTAAFTFLMGYPLTKPGEENAFFIIGRAYWLGVRERFEPSFDVTKSIFF